MSNPRVLVTVHGYTGDAHQIRMMLPFYEHHKLPIVIFSPEDSPIVNVGPHICRHGGKRAYIGPLSLERQRRHLEMMLEYPFEYFLAHDSDSVCLSPLLPAYLFAEKNVLWSNEVSDAMHTRAADYPWPQLAFQPPYFFNRRVAEQLIAAAPRVPVDAKTPFIDWCMMSWSVEGKVNHKNFRDGVSCPTSDRNCAGHMARCVEGGAVMLHSIKKPIALAQMVNARKHYNRSRGFGNVL